MPESSGLIQVAIAYHSGFGHTTRLAEAVSAGASSVAETRTVLVPVSEMTDERWKLLDASDAIVFGTPTYMGNASAAFQAFAEESSRRWKVSAWQDKVAAGFTNSGSKSGDKLHTLTSLGILAAQHGMLWVNLGLHPGWNASSASENDLNRLGIFLGAGAQSNTDEGADAMSKSDLLTGEHLGRRVAHVAHRTAGELTGV